ncbi:hypothetical protein RFI_18337, partial [Reticulomyxa filosa]
ETLRIRTYVYVTQITFFFFLLKKMQVFHINISPQAGPDVNTVMFQLLVLRHLTASNGTSFHLRKNHAVFVELPTELCDSHERKRLSDVLKSFHFFGDRITELAISFTEIADPMRKVTPRFESKVKYNHLKLNEKEMFVLKYLDALEKGKLKNTGRAGDDWRHDKCESVDVKRMEDLLNLYARGGLKCFHLFTYF